MILKSNEEIIGALEKGDLSKDLNAGIHEVLKKLDELGEGKGGITLKIKFAAKGDMVSVQSSVDTTLPQKKRRTSNFFLSGGKLSLQHPDQYDAFESRRRDAVDAD